MTEIKERPILFSSAMVRALLAGTKTQTRRVVKITPRNSPGCVPYRAGNGEYFRFPVSPEDFKKLPKSMQQDERSEGQYFYGACPYGQPGDRLWVRETWAATYQNCACYIQPCDCTVVDITYVADGSSQRFDDNSISEGWQMPKAVEVGKNGSCLFMPRWASRLLLEITAVRCERLQDISESDAVAEGVLKGPLLDKDSEPIQSYMDYMTGVGYGAHCAHYSYKTLWQSINGPDSWAANPWVWVVEFKVISSK